jgi:CHRD domain
VLGTLVKVLNRISAVVHDVASYEWKPQNRRAERKRKKMRTLKVITLAVVPTLLLALICAPTLNASNESHKANLLGFDEVPAVSSTGTGEFRAKIDEDNQIIEYELTYENLEGTTTNAAHIHIGQESVNGGVVAFLCGGGGKPACTATSGTFSGTITVADIVAVPAQGIAAGEWGEVVRAMRAGRIYANVHTNKHPGGEIRGQVK